MSVILKTEKLRVEFKSRELRQGTKTALHGLDLEVSAGEVFGFLGPNGAGKTTTMNVLLGFVPPTSGAAYLFGIDVRQPIARQRIGLAQALINNPDLLILDEPTSGLDPLGRMKVREIIQRLKNEGKTVFFSSHELGEVETVCDRVAIVHQGELKAAGSVHAIMQGHPTL